MRPTALLASIATVVLVTSACGSDGSSGDTVPASAPTTTAGSATTDTTAGTTSANDDQAATEQMFPDVIGAEAQRDGDTWTISATLSSPYDTPERYADAWRVVGPDGAVYGERILTHDHASEQPFTRSESGIEIPDDVTEVVIEGRDLENGYGGETYTLVLPS